MPFNFDNVRIQLHAEHYMMNDCWLKDCVDYYTTEVNPQAVQAEIVKFVKDQWILSDLREINNQRGCLPKNLAQQKVTSLPGVYILQVEKGYDISTSKYKQLEKIRKVSSENIEVTENERNPTWEPKTKRMMNLYLTDGIQDVTAIEHKPIPFLKDHILPGYKIMIKGPVVCRRSVIMLESNNCSHVGGEIEALLIKNATENVLARALKVEENPDPYNDKPKDDGDNELKSLDECMDIDIDALEEIEKKYGSKNDAKPSSTSKTPSNPSSGSKRRESVMLDSLPVAFDTIPEVENDFADDFDDEFIGIDETNLNVVGSSETPAAEPENTKINSAKKVERLSSIDDFPTDLDFDDFEMDYMDIKEETSHKIKENTSANAKSSTVTNSTKSNATVNTKSTFNLKSSNTFGSKATGSSETAVKITDKTQPVPLFSGSVVSRSPMKNDKVSPSNQKVAKPFATPSKNPPKAARKETPKTNPKNERKITNFFEKKLSDEKKSSPAAIDNYDLIKDIEKIMPVSKEMDKKIKGTIVSLKQLEKRNSDWYLEGVVSDNTGSISVAFAPSILKRLIGFSLSEFSARKKLKKTNPEVEKELRQGLRGAEFKLSNLHSLLRCKLLPNNPVLHVDSMIDLTGGQRKEL
ncbi:recQ-mediated genome instability protein 1-like isoform X2 [Microplitis mediator]|uniref:recQ-mediated genome instability protein 1-like isoform X2 n=1 Tax=Microplitis mediator TaxID=375433 RepID=UPI0025579858|nr:recQ-mediated genome instability protein 1-like isoform X2 [Microplitis mediator]